MFTRAVGRSLNRLQSSNEFPTVIRLLGLASFLFNLSAFEEVRAGYSPLRRAGPAKIHHVSNISRLVKAQWSRADLIPPDW